MPSRSYLSQVELPVTFGLGDHAAVDAVTITWPDGATQSLLPAEVDTTLTVTQPDAGP